jgi:hypothetical protein
MLLLPTARYKVTSNLDCGSKPLVARIVNRNIELHLDLDGSGSNPEQEQVTREGADSLRKLVVQSGS